MVSAEQTKEHYRADIDGLRAVAVMAVVLHHLAPGWVPGGFIGVDVFFVISGYLITRIINREIQEGTFTFARFYERRIRRLFPALFAVLVFVLVAGWFILLPSDYLATFRAAAGTVLFSANIVFWRDLAEGYFAADAKLNPLLHMWSLGIEEQFYLLFPVFLLLVYRYARQWLVPALMAAFALSLVLSVALTPIKSVASYFLLPTRAWELLAGSLLAVLSVPQLQSRIWREVLAAASLVAITAPAMLYSAQTPFPGYAALLPVAGAVALIWLGGGPVTLTSRLLQLKPAVYIGLISYSLYLWHWPLIVFSRYLNGLMPTDQWLPLLLLVAIAAAALSHRFIEMPFRRTPAVPQRRMQLTGAAVSTALLLLVLIAGILRMGYEQRVDAEVLALDKERSQTIPFVQCDRVIGGCRIGAEVSASSGAEPSILLWGDSHMLAWAPVLDVALKERGLAATLRFASACPPIFGVEAGKETRCGSHSEDIKHQLVAGEFDTVVLAAYWSTYESRVVMDDLPATMRAIEQMGVDTYLIEPVPVYDYDVPARRAISAMWRRTQPRQTRDQHLHKHDDFFEAISELQNRLVEISGAACNPECLLVDATGAGLYRDAHHLSVAGAMQFHAQMSNMLGEIVVSKEGGSHVADEIQDHPTRRLQDASHAGGWH